MKKLRFLLFTSMLFLFAGYLSAQSVYWLKTCDSLDNCGYVDQNGEIRITPGKYPQCFTDTLYYFAIVYKPGSGLIAINKNEKELFHVWVVDNGPDYPSEGLFRIVKDGKIGFANMKGKIIIPPRFDAVFPFQNGKAAFCAGCQTKKNDLTREYSYWTGGLWGFINKSGEVIVEPEYQRKWNKELKKYQFERRGETLNLKDGKLVREE